MGDRSLSMDVGTLGISGPNLRFFRQLRRLSQRELGARVTPKFSQADVSRLERRGLRPSDGHAVDAVALALGVPKQALLNPPRFIRNLSRAQPIVLRGH